MWVVVEGGLCSVAELGGDGIVWLHSVDVDLGVLDNLSVLLVDTADLLEVAGGLAVVGNELSDDGHLGVGVDSLALAIEAGVSHTVGVEVASVLVADTEVSVWSVVAALGAGAALLLGGGARVRSVGGSHAVGLPDIHLVAASSVLALTGVWIEIRWSPSVDVALERIS